MYKKFFVDLKYIKARVINRIFFINTIFLFIRI